MSSWYGSSQHDGWSGHYGGAGWSNQWYGDHDWKQRSWEEDSDARRWKHSAYEESDPRQWNDDWTRWYSNGSARNDQGASQQEPHWEQNHDDHWGDDRRWSEDNREECRRDSWGGYTTATSGGDQHEMASTTSVEQPATEDSKAAGGKPRTGKEVVPSWDGKSPIRDYKRRVELFLSTTGIDEEYRAGRLIEQLTAEAWRATATIDMSKLKAKTGVQYLLEHLQAELEPLEHMRVFGVLHGFYRGFKRQRGQEFLAFDTAFRAELQKLEEVGAPITGLSKAFWFLECAQLSDDLRKQVITAAHGKYAYEDLRAALVAIVPKIKAAPDGDGAGHVKDEKSNQTNRFFRQKPAGRPHRVNMVEDDDQPDNEIQEEEEPNEQEEAEDEAEDDMPAEELEQQAQILMTEAARRRSKVERQRGFSKSPNPENASDRNQRIKNMKSTMACSACRANGQIRFGHWHKDPECPFYKQSSDTPKSSQSQGVFCTLTEDEDSDEAFIVHEVIHQVLAAAPAVEENCVERQPGSYLALTDTCCARTVAGKAWMDDFVKHLWEKGIMCHVLREDRKSVV